MWPNKMEIKVSQMRQKLDSRLFGVNDFLTKSPSVCVSCSVMSDSLRLCGLYSPWSSPGQDTGVGSLSLLQGIFPTQGSNPGLLRCRRILYQLSHKGSPSPSVAAANSSVILC